MFFLAICLASIVISAVVGPTAGKQFNFYSVLNLPRSLVPVEPIGSFYSCEWATANEIWGSGHATREGRTMPITRANTADAPIYLNGRLEFFTKYFIFL